MVNSVTWGHVDLIPITAIINMANPSNASVIAGNEFTGTGVPDLVGVGVGDVGGSPQIEILSILNPLITTDWSVGPKPQRKYTSGAASAILEISNSW